MNESFNTYELVEKYCLGLMDDQEKLFFEIEMENNPALNQLVQEHLTLLRTFEHQQHKDFIVQALQSIHPHPAHHTPVLLTQLRRSVHKYWRTASVAASVAFIASMLTFLLARSVYKKDTHAQYQILKGEINTIKKDQKDIKKEVDQVKQDVALPDYPSKFSGTGFVISRNGYLVTNLHVVDGYTKIFTVTADGAGHASSVVATDEENDLAVLKLDDNNLPFNGKLPYSLHKSSPALANRVFSLGFPKNEVVYNEGYISSTTGFEGDTNKFQLELPSGPGVSGAPVLDDNGNILGVISGKQSQTEGVTYAIKSKALINLLKSLPKEDFSLSSLQDNNPRVLNRNAQISQIQKYVCLVKVYN